MVPASCAFDLMTQQWKIMLTHSANDHFSLKANTVRNTFNVPDPPPYFEMVIGNVPFCI